MLDSPGKDDGRASQAIVDNGAQSSGNLARDRYLKNKRAASKNPFESALTNAKDMQALLDENLEKNDAKKLQREKSKKKVAPNGQGAAEDAAATDGKASNTDGSKRPPDDAEADFTKNLGE